MFTCFVCSVEVNLGRGQIDFIPEDTKTPLLFRTSVGRCHVPLVRFLYIDAFRLVCHRENPWRFLMSYAEFSKAIQLFARIEYVV